MRTRLLSGAALAVVLAAWACGGSSYSNPSPVVPTPTPGGGGGAGTTIAILGDRGANSFNPNPGTVSQGATVAWTNTDGTTHRIVMNDGSLDTGNIAPGQTSAALTMLTDGGNYHCSIHPTMVGSIRASSGNPPPCTGQYC
jgi:plastocyanin